ncbi:MAG: hypothetical protein RI949_863 [Pseudomonadota bacterium]|jgi:hypothetical protein|nr:hypothetical protein [Betaproteobacteria bacterium]
MVTSSHSLIGEWAQDAGLELQVQGPSRQLSVTVDRVRVHLLELPSKGILIESRIMDLPLNPLDRDRMVRRAMGFSVGRLRDSSAALVADAQASCLMLQRQLIDPSSARQVGTAIEQLVNEVDLWRAAL